MEINSSNALFKWPKLEGKEAPSHAHIFSKVTGSKFLDSHSVQISRKPNIYVFEDD